MTKLFALGALGAGFGTGVYAIGRAVKRRSAARRAQSEIDSEFDYTDVEGPVIVEEVIVVTEPTPF